jgi:hypothetical protein
MSPADNKTVRRLSYRFLTCGLCTLVAALIAVWVRGLSGADGLLFDTLLTIRALV